MINGEMKEVCSAKVRKLGERVGQAWRLHVHPQDATRSAYVNRKGEVKWNLQDLEVPTVEQRVKEDALEVQDIRELGLGWLGLLMTCELFFLLGKIWNLPLHLQKNHSRKLQVMCLWNHSQCMLMLHNWQWTCTPTSNLWPLRLLVRKSSKIGQHFARFVTKPRTRTETIWAPKKIQKNGTYL